MYVRGEGVMFSAVAVVCQKSCSSEQLQFAVAARDGHNYSDLCYTAADQTSRGEGSDK